MHPSVRDILGPHRRWWGLTLQHCCLVGLCVWDLIAPAMHGTGLASGGAVCRDLEIRGGLLLALWSGLRWLTFCWECVSMLRVGRSLYLRVTRPRPVRWALNRREVGASDSLRAFSKVDLAFDV